MRGGGFSNIIPAPSSGSDDPDAALREGDTSCCAAYGSMLVVPRENRVRKVWQLVIALLLIYTGTIFPFRLAFYDFRITGEDEEEEVETPIIWQVVQIISDRLFELDLVAGFFFSFNDQFGAEVKDLRLIVMRYLKGVFWINVVACIPPPVIGLLYARVAGIDPSESDGVGQNNVHQVARIARLQRVSKLSRLVRLARLEKLVAFLVQSPFLKWLWNFRTTRVINFLAGLLWVSHLMACGWYCVSALQDDWTETWVYARLAPEGAKTIPFEPFKAWLNSIYWVLTVFTTVGFGDICPKTSAEIMYAMVTMLVGCIANGIILSEVINVITESDQFAREINNQKELTQGFCQHVKLRQDCATELLQWVSDARAFQYNYDRKAMKDMFLGSTLPTSLTSRLPAAVLNGSLLSSRFIRVGCQGLLHVPSRFVLLIALAMNARMFDWMETVYNAHDHAWNIFIVYKGIFANVAKPSAVGGISEVPGMLQNAGRITFGDHTVKETEMDRYHEALEKAHQEELYKAVIRKDQVPVKIDTPGFAPYQTFAFGNYFGDVELFRRRKGARRTCTRCESKKGGTLLIVGHSALNDITEAFPMAASCWRVTAAQREVSRIHLLSKMKTSIDYKNLAAYIVQWHVRERLRRRGKGPGNSGPKVWGIEPTYPAEVHSIHRFESRKTKVHLQADVEAMSKQMGTIEQDLKSAHRKVDYLVDEFIKLKKSASGDRYPLRMSL